MEAVIIKELGMTGFGKFRNHRINLDEGINLIQGSNEAGKSTIQSFITGMFFGFYSTTAKRRSYLPLQGKYLPWDGGPYRGYLVCSCGEREYRIEREFSKEAENVRVIDAATGEDITEEFPYNSVTRLYEPGEKLLGVTKTSFNSTANVSQLGCSGVSSEPGFSGEMNDKLVSMLKTADADLSITAAQEQLDKKLDEIGNPKKSKSPYGLLSQRQKKLEEELESVRLTEDETFNLCVQLNKLHLNQEELEKEKSLLEAQVKESVSKELGGIYLQAQNITARIQRLEREAERYESYAQVNVEQIDQAQKKMGARSQILRTINKYDRALEELEKRLQEMNNLYGKLELTTADDSVLERFDQMYERFCNNLTLQDEIKQMQIKYNNLSFNLGKMTEIDGSHLEEDLKEYDRLEQEKTVKAPQTSPYLLPILISGIALILLGVALAGFSSVLVPGILLCIIGVGLCVVSYFISKSTKTVTGTDEDDEDRLMRVEAFQQEILRQYQFTPEQSYAPRAYLETLLGKVQVNNYKVTQFREQGQLLQAEIAEKTDKHNKVCEELEEYLKLLTEQSNTTADVIQMKTWMESVKKAKRIRLEIQKLNLQQQHITQERKNCTAQISEIERNIEETVKACKMGEADVPENLDRYRVGKEKLSEIMLELGMQKQLLEQCLGNYHFEELEKAAQDAKAATGEPSDQQEQQRVQHRLKHVEEEYNLLLQQIASAEGRQQVLEKTQRPIGEVEKELKEAEELAAEYEQEISALELAKKRIAMVSSQMHRDFAPQLNQKVSNIVSYLTDGKYKKVMIDQNMQITLIDEASGKSVDLSALSNGTIDLLYLSMRMELAVLLRGGVTVPILLDDSFTQLDDQRLEKMLHYLADTQTAQILLFSCQSREKVFLDSLQIEYNTVILGSIR